jgi:hypothetical protein
MYDERITLPGSQVESVVGEVVQNEALLSISSNIIRVGVDGIGLVKTSPEARCIAIAKHSYVGLKSVVRARMLER